MWKSRIYLDYASLTPIDPRVLHEVKKFSAIKYGNPSSWYREGVDAKKSLDSARKSIADHIHAHSDEIVFTSGGTEANNLAILGAYNSYILYLSKNSGIKDSSEGVLKPHLIISCIEHSSIIEVAKHLEKNGCEITRLSVDEKGIVSIEELKKSIKPNTFMVSIMTVNNEIGTVQPIREIAKIMRKARNEFISVRLADAVSSTSKNEEENGVAKRTNHEISNRFDVDGYYPQASLIDNFSRQNYPLFHTDGAQAALCNELYVEKLGVDLLSLDSSKVYGPRGVGALYVKRNTPIEPIIFGGGQEAGMRSGTENLPGVAGFAKALSIQDSKILEFREMMIDGLRSIRNDIVVNGPEKGDSVSPHILNVSIPRIDNEFLVLQLDADGIACSTKSSCLRDEKESYVLKAIGANSSESIRFSFGRWTKKRDINKALKVIGMLLSKDL
ncbi:MAG: cysteine desulfurase family protein [Candidatus Taylorbacteria bacterium]